MFVYLWRPDLYENDFDDEYDIHEFLNCDTSRPDEQSKEKDQSDEHTNQGLSNSFEQNEMCNLSEDSEYSVELLKQNLNSVTTEK